MTTARTSAPAPAELGGVTLTPAPLPPATRVFVSGQHAEAPGWWYVTAFLPGAIVRGYVQGFRVTTDLPEPTAKLCQLQPGDTAERLAVQPASPMPPARAARYSGTSPTWAGERFSPTFSAVP